MLHIDVVLNLIFSLWRTEGVMRQLPDAYEGELSPMVTYTDLFSFIIMLCAVITLVYTQRKK